MSSQEFRLRKLLEDSTFFIKNAEEDEEYVTKCKECMDDAEQIIMENTRDSFAKLSAEVVVMYVEVALLTNTRDDSASRVTDIFFQRINQEDQFFCRALLAKATIEERKIKKMELKGDDNFKQVNLAFSYIKRAIEIAARGDNRAKYQFIVYNSSIKTWQIIRGLMRPGWSKLLVEILEKISTLLEELDDSDLNWRCRYLNGLLKAMFDAEKKPEALKVLDKLVDLTKKKGPCNFQETLFRNRIHFYRDNNGMLQNVKKETETGEDPLALKYLFAVQSIKSGVIPDAQVEKELQTVMAAIAPASVSANDESSTQSSKIPPIQLDRLAECGRMAIKYGLVPLAEGACSVVNRANQKPLRAQVWTLYSDAEILLQKPTADIDPATGMKLNTLQRQFEDRKRRETALQIMERAMIANKKLADPDIIIEGCYIIWNMSLPFLKDSLRTFTYKPFIAAVQALEQIQATDNQLRVNLHLELAKQEIARDTLSKAVVQLQKCLDIDASLTMKSGTVGLTEDDDIANFQRPQDKLIKFLMKKLQLKTDLYGGGPSTVQDQIIFDVESAKTSAKTAKSQKMRETLLDKALKALQEFEEPVYKVDPDKDLVEEEIEEEKKKFHLKIIKERKERVLIANEMAKLALEENLVELAFDAATLAVKDAWDPIKDHDLIIAQSESHAVLAKCYVEFLLEEEIEIGHKDLVTLEEDQDERDFTNEDRTRFREWKVKFTEHIIEAIKLGSQAGQTWLIFNGAVEFWNNYLPIFKQLSFYEIILEEGIPAMDEAFEGMNNCFENANFSADNVDYELAKKMNIFTNMSMMLARIREYLANNDGAAQICDTLLQKQLPSHMRKTFDSIKARVKPGAPGGAAAAKGAPAGKGAKDGPVAVQVSQADQVSAEVLGALELIKNGNKDLIQKAMDALAAWSPNEQEEIELELNAELWCRLGRLSIEQGTNQFTKISLYCAEQAMLNGDAKIKAKDYGHIPYTRLRWYSVAECLYGESLYKLVDTKKQEKESQDKLLHAAVAHFVESCNIASKAGIGYLLLESCKCMWNALLGVLDAPNNRKLLIKPLSQVHSYLKDVQENSDPDFLALLYSALFLCIQEQKDWNLGEKIVEEAFSYVPSSHQKVLWEAKMNFLSKLGKNVLSAISNMKESNASLMAKVWVKLARSSAQDLEQHSAYNKAIEILRKEESVEVVEVLIEYAEWMQRKKYSSQDVEDQLLLAVDILMDIEPGWDEEEDETNEDNEDDRKTRKTGKSKSSKFSKGSKAQTRKSRAGKSVKRSVAGRSKVSNASKRSKSMKSGASRASKKTKTALSQRMEEDGQPPFLNCQHFEKLVRVHSMLATIAHDSTKQREYTLDAHFFIMKMWEQSFQSLNATLFFEQHKQQIEELGFSVSDQESRQQYFQEVLTSSDMAIPVVHALPEKPEDWATFSVPEELIKRAKTHEDKIMISRYAFAKPELTLYHINNVFKLLEDHYFSIQQLPVLHLLQFFNQEVIQDKILAEVAIMKRARLLMNLGLKSAADMLIEGKEHSYILNDEEKKLNFEKIKALKDPADDDAKKLIPFHVVDEGAPTVLEQIRIHESWLQLADEHIKWGNYVLAKDLLNEVTRHARILKDQPSFARSLLARSTVAYLEGESGSALKLDMMSHRYTQKIEFMAEAIVHTYDLLVEFNKIDDCQSLLDGSITMLTQIKESAAAQKSANDAKKSQDVQVNVQNNLPLEYALNTCYLLRATLFIQESMQVELIEEQEPLIKKSFEQIDKFDAQQLQIGCNQSHLIRLLNFSKLLQSQITNNMRQVNLQSVEFAKFKLEKCAKILLKVQELLTDQMYYIGIHQDSSKSTISLPLTRLLGVVKVRLAQINTDIGVIKNQIRQGASQGAGGDQGSAEDKKKLDKVVATFMDAVTKQIEAQANTYSKEMNRYEKSITMLQSALNMLHKECQENAECLVEIARCKRLLAVNKKHLRGQWRQDALDVDDVSLNKSIVDDGKDRAEALGDKGLDGEVADIFVDYKEEALKAFVGILTNNLITEPEVDAAKPPGGKDQPPADGEERKPAKSLTFSQLLDNIGSNRLDNVLATFALEYAESRGNLNKEQAFFYLAHYQYALSRQSLYQMYLKATTEKHPDVQRLRQIKRTSADFSYFTSPYMPSSFYQNKKTLTEKSKPFKILHSFYELDDMKENLPHSTAYLILQLSDDEQYLYSGFMIRDRDRKVSYYVTKLALPSENRAQLFRMITTLAQNKQTMQKAPITIPEDLENLERDSNEEINKLLEQMEAFFKPITQELEPLIHPQSMQDAEEGADAAAAAPAKGGAKADPKKDDKKAAKPPAKGGKGGAEAQLAAYESNLPLPASGIESLILLLDSKIESLPLESLNVFGKIPVVARDFNLHIHVQRLKALEHQAELHNNRGVSKEQLSFIVDPPKDEVLVKKAETLVKSEMPKMTPGLVWNGIFTPTEHNPSTGEWQEKIAKSQLFAYYSMTCLLHKFPPALVTELSIFSQCRAMIIFDRMNSFKTLVDRNVVTSRHFVPSEQPVQEAALFSLCGVNTIVTNHWSTKPENNLELFDQLLRGVLTDGLYMGASLKRYWETYAVEVQDLEPSDPQRLAFELNTRNLFRHNTCTYGVPIVRVV